MKLLCHRGHWLHDREKNEPSALSRAFEAGHGIETDVRDCDGELVISHDPPVKGKVVTFEHFLKAYSGAARNGCLALNIKSDGLHDAVNSALESHGVRNYFVFDMSVPDTLGYLKRSMTFGARISEYEAGGLLLEQASFAWLDIFHSDWYDTDLVASLLDQGKRVAIVSPELHKRQHESLWRRVQPIASHPMLYLCTDLVDQAQEFFDVDYD